MFYKHPRCYRLIYAQVAQSVEQRTENPRVGGSIPSLSTIKKASLAGAFLMVCKGWSKRRHEELVFGGWR